MKPTLIIPMLLLVAAALPAQAHDLSHRGFFVQRVPLGSGTPAAGVTHGNERARHVADDAHHVPNQLPGHPTAATIWPREVALECETDARSGELVCEGYAVHPALGRGEYIYVRPLPRQAPPAVHVTCPCCPAPEPRPEPPLTRKKPLG